MLEGKANRILTQFNEDGNMCIQREMLNGEPKYDYYIVLNKYGYSSKISTEDNTPIWESPDLKEKKTEYRDGKTWPYYTKNGIMVAMTNDLVKDYGKWYQISLIISNHSIAPIDFDPEKITSTLIDKKGREVVLEVYSSDQYMRKVRRRQNWNMIRGLQLLMQGSLNLQQGQGHLIMDILIRMETHMPMGREGMLMADIVGREVIMVTQQRFLQQ